MHSKLQGRFWEYLLLYFPLETILMNYPSKKKSYIWSVPMLFWQIHTFQERFSSFLSSAKPLIEIESFWKRQPTLERSLRPPLLSLVHLHKYFDEGFVIFHSISIRGPINLIELILFSYKEPAKLALLGQRVSIFCYLL